MKLSDIEQKITKNNLIGKGSMSKCYSIDPDQVAILSVCAIKLCIAERVVTPVNQVRGVKLPDITYVDTLNDDNLRLYISTKYTPLSKTGAISRLNKSGKKFYRLLLDFSKKLNSELSSNIFMNKLDNPEQITSNFIENCDIFNENQKEFMSDLFTAGKNYADLIFFDICRKNLAVDDKGNLILLDVLFSKAILKEGFTV